MFLRAPFNIADAPSFYGGLAFLWIFSAAVSAMERPKSSDGCFYQWLYRFSHLLAANLDRVTVAELSCRCGRQDMAAAAVDESALPK